MYSLTHLTQKAPKDLKDDDVNKANNALAQLIAGILKYLEIEPSREVRKTWNGEFNPTTEDEWVRLLFMNIFDGCAMTYRGCESQSLAHADKQVSTIVGQSCIQYFAGSTYEGLGCASPEEYSDTDIMNVLQNFTAIEETEDDCSKQALTPSAGVVIKHDKGAKSLHDSSTPQFSKSDQNKNKPCEKLVLIGKGSNSGYVQIIKSHDASDLLKIAEALNHGPVIRSTDRENLLVHEFEFDNAIAVECKHWPQDALQWETRERKSGWPGEALISRCLPVPCTIVSKSHALNPDDRYEWRFSFTRQEGILLRSLPIAIKMVYIISKVLLKQVVLKGGLLTSYHLKTVFLWYCENTSSDEFIENELEINVNNFLYFLVKQLEKHSIPNYFIPQRNMVSHISRDEIKTCKTKIECFLSNRLDGISSVRTGKQYPFCISDIARDLMHRSSKSISCLQRLFSNFLDAIVDHLFYVHLPNSHVMWMYFRYIPLLVKQGCLTNERVSTIFQQACGATELALKIFGNDFIKLTTLYCSLIEIHEPTFRDSSRSLLSSSFSAQNDPLSSCSCIADVLNLIAFELGASATESCCIALKEWELKNQTGKDIFMLTMKNTLRTFGTSRVGQKYEHIPACLVAIVNALELSKGDIEVGMATSLRLYSSSKAINVISTLCDLIESVDMNSVIKQLVYATVLFLEEEEKTKHTTLDTERKSSKDQKSTTDLNYRGGLKDHALHEAKKALKTIEDIISNILSTGTDTFRFVLAVIVFQKMTMDSPNLEIVRAILKFIISSNLSKKHADIEELQTDIESLLQTENVDIGNAFQFVVFYTWKNIASSGLSFVSSVLDELVKSHFNLGILSAAGTELIALGKTEESIAAIYLWVTRSTGAPITQNPLLRVKMYGKLGYLYHIKAKEAEDIGTKTKLIEKSSIMFRTAIKEKVSDITVLIDFLLLLWDTQNLEDFEFYLKKACASDDFSSISVYFEQSKSLMCNMDDIKIEIERKGQIKVYSKVFAHFIFVAYSEENRASHNDPSDVASRGEKSQEHVQQMQKCIDILNLIN